MDTEALFGMALELTSPWRVRRVECSTETARLDIYLTFLAGPPFAVRRVVWRARRPTTLRRRPGGT